MVNSLNEQSKVVARILNDVLSLQKIEDGALQLEMAPFNLIEMVCGTLRSFQPLLAEKNLVLASAMEDVDQAISRFQRSRRAQRDQRTAAAAAGALAGHGPMSAAGADADADERKGEDGALSPDALSVRVDSMDGESAAKASSVAGGSAPVLGGASLQAAVPVPASLSTVITPSAPASLASGAAPYLNAYEDSKELQRIAESCSREVEGDRYRLRQVLANYMSNGQPRGPAQQSRASRPRSPEPAPPCVELGFDHRCSDWCRSAAVATTVADECCYFLSL